MDGVSAWRCYELSTTGERDPFRIQFIDFYTNDFGGASLDGPQCTARANLSDTVFFHNISKISRFHKELEAISCLFFFHA